MEASLIRLIAVKEGPGFPDIVLDGICQPSQLAGFNDPAKGYRPDLVERIDVPLTDLKTH
ncbi:MAG: hypothetical protein P8Y92_11455 [Halioglobus sp.]